MILNVSTLSTQSWSEDNSFLCCISYFFTQKSRQLEVSEDIRKLVGAQIIKRRHNQLSFIPNNIPMEILSDVVYLLLHNSNYVLAAAADGFNPALRIFDSSMQISRLQEASEEDIATVVLQMIINNYCYAAASTIASQFDDGRSAQRL